MRLAHRRAHRRAWLALALLLPLLALGAVLQRLARRGEPPGAH